MENDLISRSALLEKECCGRISGDDVRNAPAVDAEPLRHGQWLTDIYDMKTYETKTVPFEYWKHSDAYCSECKAFALCNGHEESVPSRYCPHCGAMMDGVADV